MQNSRATDDGAGVATIEILRAFKEAVLSAKTYYLICGYFANEETALLRCRRICKKATKQNNLQSVSLLKVMAVLIRGFGFTVKPESWQN